MVIARNHEDVYGRKSVEMDPTSLPQLSEQLRDQKKQPENWKKTNFKKLEKPEKLTSIKVWA